MVDSEPDLRISFPIQQRPRCDLPDLHRQQARRRKGKNDQSDPSGNAEPDRDVEGAFYNPDPPQEQGGKGIDDQHAYGNPYRS